MAYRLRFLRLLLALAVACVVMAMAGERAEAQQMLTSWYGPGFEGNLTANGEIYDPWGYTAAHKTLPFGTEMVVSYGGNSLQVRVNDRGPYVGARELDLSQGAASYLGLDQAGVDYVDYTVLGYGDNEYVSQETPVPEAEPDMVYEEASYTVDPVSDGVTDVGAVPGGEAYVVQPGDTLSEVAVRLGTSVEYLVSANGVADPDLILSGSTLYV